MKNVAALALLLAACSCSEPEERGGLSRLEADELNEAAAMLDAQQQRVDEALRNNDHLTRD